MGKEAPGSMSSAALASAPFHGTTLLLPLCKWLLLLTLLYLLLTLPLPPLPGLCSFGFNERETVAINGAHNLGRAHPQFTGFTGQWVRDNDQLSGCE